MSGTRDAGTADAGVKPLPLLPAIPDADNVAACEKCAKKNCGAQRASCLEDDACIAQLACTGACSDPACIQDCAVLHPTSAWFDDYWRCVLNDRCAGPCKSGENFACAGNYDWSTAPDPRFRAHIRFAAPPQLVTMGDEQFDRFVSGIDVNVCAADDPLCTIPLDHGTFDTANAVDLNLRVDKGTRSFTGYLELEPADTGYLFLERMWWYPLTYPGDVRILAFNRDSLVTGSNGSFQLAKAAPLVSFTTDCLGMPANGLRVELIALPKLTPLYEGTAGVTFSASSPPTAAALFPDIPEAMRERPLTIRAYRADGTTIVAERESVSVRIGAITHVLVPPRAR